MNINKLLGQVLNSSAVKQHKDKLSGLTGSSGSSGASLLKKAGLGAAGGSLLTSMLKKGKGSTLLKVGGAAAIGALAYKIYNNYQIEQSAARKRETFEDNDPQHPVIILKAMIAAAKADGHIDEAEMSRIHDALAKSDAGSDEKVFLEGEINKPLDPADVAAMATSPAMAAEIYLASSLVIDEQNYMEKVYLRELAALLRLDDEMVRRLNESGRT